MPTEFLHGSEVIEIDSAIRPIRTVKSSIIGLVGTAPLADAAKFPLNEPVAILGNQHQIADLGATGTLADALTSIFYQTGAVVVVVRVDEGVDIDATLSNVVGNAGTFTGLHALLTAEEKLQLTPRILIAPGFTSQRPGALANPVVSALLGVAEKLKSVIFADGPSTNYADAVTWRQDFDSARLHVTEPAVMIWDTATSQNIQMPAAPVIAGTQVWLDHNRGFWHSPSNRPLNSIAGIARPIGFAMSDKDSEANLLNEQNINTIVHYEGWRSWGNHTCSSDEQWRFTAVRRTADMINDSLIRAAITWMDRPLSQPQLILNIVESGRTYMRQLKSLGAIVGGDMWIDENFNQDADLMAGHLTVSFDSEPPAPLERLTMRSHRNPTYYNVLIQDVIREINQLAA